jgi:hypothetical protein
VTGVAPVERLEVHAYTIPTDDIKDLRCEMTLVKGRIVYERVATPTLHH